MICMKKFPFSDTFLAFPSSRKSRGEIGSSSYVISCIATSPGKFYPS